MDSPPGRSATTIATAAVVAAALMTCFELFKERVAPGLTKWESHFVTVVVTTCLATIVASYVVSQQRRAAAALRLNEEDLRITLESIGDGVITTDRHGKVTRMNPVAVRLTGWPLEEARGRPLADVFRIVNADTRAPAEDPVARVIASGEIIGLANHTTLIARDGAEHAIADAGAPIRKDAGELVGVVLSFRDVSEEERLRSQIAQTQRLDALGMLAGGVAHDFNNLLTAIIGASELLHVQLPAGDGAHEQVELITEASQRAADLTRRLLAFSRQQPVAFQPTDVHEAVRSAMALLQRSIDKRIAIVPALSATASVVLGDATQLQSLFLNLGVNAAHAMPEGGTLSFSSRSIVLDEGACEASPFGLRPGPHVVLDVRDTGHGIAADVLGRIFDPFFTTKEQGAGTGLGLSAAYGAIKQHRGAITVTSEVGKGTLFQVTLALTDAAIAKRGHSAAPAPMGSGRILLVDDERTVRLAVQRMLKQLGYDVVVASNGREGLETFEREEGEFDLVLLDMVMPELSGTDCFRALRKRDPEATVVLSSGFARDADVDALIGDGARGFLRKPYTASELGRAIADALARGR